MKKILLPSFFICILAMSCGGREDPGQPAVQVPDEQPAPFDARFIDAMTDHHLGAVAMAGEALDSTVQPEIVALAEGIIAGQSIEIDSMAAWRERWYPGLGATGGMGMSMGSMEVAASDGVSWDVRFLQAMISHHQGAIPMAQAALESAEHEELRVLAAGIITAQQEEIVEMTGLVSTLGGSDSAP